MRVTVLPCVFLCVFTIGFLLDDESSLRRVLERWCRLLRCRCLLWCRRLLLEHSESAGSVVVRDSSSSSAWLGFISVHVLLSDHVMLSPSCCSNPLSVVPRSVKVQDLLSISNWKSGKRVQLPSSIVTRCTHWLTTNSRRPPRPNDQ